MAETLSMARREGYFSQIFTPNVVESTVDQEDRILPSLDYWIEQCISVGMLINNTQSEHTTSLQSSSDNA